MTKPMVDPEFRKILTDPNLKELEALTFLWRGWLLHVLPRQTPAHFMRIPVPSMPGVQMLKPADTYAVSGPISVSGKLTPFQAVVGIIGATWEQGDKLIARPEIRVFCSLRMTTDTPWGPEKVLPYARAFLGEDAYALLTKLPRVMTGQAGASTMYIFRSEDAPPSLKAS